MQGQIEEMQVNLIMETESKKTVDELFLQDGIEEEQIQFTFKTLNLATSPEFQAIAEQLKARGQ